jgi:uncharacterized membrane protein
MARKKKKGEFVGIGALLQGIGLVLLFFFPIGTLIGIILFFVGSAKAFKLICDNCGNGVEKTALICPTCKEAFE